MLSLLSTLKKINYEEFPVECNKPSSLPLFTITNSYTLKSTASPLFTKLQSKCTSKSRKQERAIPVCPLNSQMIHNQLKQKAIHKGNCTSSHFRVFSVYTKYPAKSSLLQGATVKYSDSYTLSDVKTSFPATQKQKLALNLKSNSIEISTPYIYQSRSSDT